MTNNNEDLEFYGAQNGFSIHVIDSNPAAILSELDDVS